MKIINYVIYLLIFIIVCVGIYLLTVSHKKLVVNSQSIILEIEEQEQISAYVTGDNQAEIKYVSVDNNIAYVNQTGVVTGINEGSTIIKISYRDQTFECSVTVKDEKTKKITSISFPKDNLVIGVGNSHKLDYILEPDYEYDTIEFKTSKPEVLTVSRDGIVTALQEGNAIISVIVNNEVSKDLIVYAFNNATTMYADLPESIVTFDNISLDVDEEKELLVTVLPRSSSKSFLSYSSSDESVCIYQNGRIKGLKEGTCKIFIEGPYGIRKSVIVSVKKKIIAVQSIVVISSQAISLYVGQTSQIIYAVVPSNATNKAVYFESSDPSIATISSDGLITAIKSGEVLIGMRTADESQFNYVKVTVESNNSGGSGGGGGSSSCAYIHPTLGKDGSNKGCQNTSSSFFNSCFVASKDLVLEGGIQHITVGVGETKTIKVNLPGCGVFQTYTRISLDGEFGWSRYLSQCFNGVSGDGSFNWTITGKQRGTTLASITTQYEAKDPSVGGTCVGNVKSMVLISVTVT